MDNKSSQSSLLIGIVVALLVAAVAGDMIYRSFFGDTESTATVPQVSADPEQTVESSPQVAPETDADTSQSDAQDSSEPMTKPATSAEETDEQDTGTTSSDLPETEAKSESFVILQTVRVDSDGAVVIAGTGVPGQLVEILVNGKVVETALADGQGNFVSLFDLPYSDAVRVLSLRSIVDGQEFVSDQDAIIAPAQIAAAAPSKVTTETDVTPESVAAETEVAQADAASETESQPSESNTAERSVAEQPESDLQAAEIETEIASTEAQSVVEPAADSAEPTNTGSAVAMAETEQVKASTEAQSVAEPAADSAEPTNTGSTVAMAETEQVTEEASDVAAADEPDTTASVTTAQDSEANATDTDENVVLKTTDEQTSEAVPQGQTEQADASENETSSAELATVSTKDSTEAPAQSSLDNAQPADNDEGEAAATNDNTTEELATAEAETTQLATDEVIEDTADVTDIAPEVEADQTPTVMIADQDGVRVVQGGEDQSSSDVALDAISYDEEGEVALSGRGTPAAQVMVYLDNAPISSTVLDSAGQWKTDLTNVDPGVYTLRIDQLDTGGKVVSRLETPFQRENRERLIEQVAASAEPARVNVITVQPGYTLWAIARSRYGQGVLYVQVFEANRDKIRDPDLIYPGQVFQLPD